VVDVLTISLGYSLVCANVVVIKVLLGGKVSEVIELEIEEVEEVSEISEVLGSESAEV